MPERRRSSLELGQPAFLVFPLHKTLTPLSYFSVHKSASVRVRHWEWQLDGFAWGGRPSRGSGKLQPYFALTPKSWLYLSSWTSIYFCTFSFPHPEFCEHLYVSGMKLHPNKTQVRKTTPSSPDVASLKHWHRKSLNLTLPWCPNLLWNIINLHSLPQPLIKYLVSTYWEQVGISYRFFLCGGKTFECSPLWSFLLNSCVKYSFEVQMVSFVSLKCKRLELECDYGIRLFLLWHPLSFEDSFWLWGLSFRVVECYVPWNDLFALGGSSAKLSPNWTETPAGSGHVFLTCLNDRQSWGVSSWCGWALPSCSE